MNGALNFTNPHPLPLHQFSNHSSATTPAVAGSTANVRVKQSGRWWRRAIILGELKLQSRRFCVDCGNGGIRRELFRDKGTNTGAKMCAIVNGKVENLSDVSPPEKIAEEPPAKLLTLPTMLTIGRVVAVPVIVGTFYAESWWGPAATTCIFIAAAFTDWLDGYLARKMNLGTPFGAFLDPVADKLMVAATLILLCTKPFEAVMFGQAPWLLTVPAITIIGREITMSAVREWAAAQDKKLLEAVAVNNLGKWKTATQMIALTILLATRDGSLVGAGTLAYLGVVLLYTSACLALWSLFVYMRKISKVLLR